jgi:hypothetical protein
MYLAKLWIPSFVSLMIFFASGDSLSGIGVDEILHPIVHYAMIGSYLSTLSGYEPLYTPKSVFHMGVVHSGCGCASHLAQAPDN